MPKNIAIAELEAMNKSLTERLEALEREMTSKGRKTFWKLISKFFFGFCDWLLTVNHCSVYLLINSVLVFYLVGVRPQRDVSVEQLHRQREDKFQSELLKLYAENAELRFEVEQSKIDLPRLRVKYFSM